MMKKIVTTLRCVPRLGLPNTGLRVIDLDVAEDAEDRELLDAASAFFANKGIADAVYDIDVDDDGFFAIINDEAYERDWGLAVL